MSTSSHDRWLLPRRQTEFPLRDLLPEETLHARREATFLVLAMLAVLPAAVLVLVGARQVIDVSALLTRVGIESPAALRLPLGVVPFAVSLVAVALARDLFGARRAAALVWAGTASVIALAGFVRLADVVDGGDHAGAALALAAAFVVAHVVHVLVFDRLRRAARGRATFVRIAVAALLGCAFGGAALGGVLWLEAGTPLASAIASDDAIVAIAAGALVWSAATAIVLAIPAAIVARALAIALRVGRALVARRDVVDDERAASAAPAYERAASPAQVYERAARGTPAVTIERTPRTTLPGVVLPAPGVADAASASMAATSRGLPPAQIVDEEADEEVVPLERDAIRRRAPRVSIQPFSSAEMQFFREGDELG